MQILSGGKKSLRRSPHKFFEAKYCKLTCRPTLPLSTAIIPKVHRSSIPRGSLVRSFHTSGACAFPIKDIPKTKYFPKPDLTPVQGKRHWKDRIGNVYQRIRTRLVEEDPDWRRRLNPWNRGKWKEYVEQQRDNLDPDFGEPFSAARGAPRHENDRFDYVRWEKKLEELKRREREKEKLRGPPRQGREFSSRRWEHQEPETFEDLVRKARRQVKQDIRDIEERGQAEKEARPSDFHSRANDSKNYEVARLDRSVNADLDRKTTLKRLARDKERESILSERSKSRSQQREVFPEREWSDSRLSNRRTFSVDSSERRSGTSLRNTPLQSYEPPRRTNVRTTSDPPIHPRSKPMTEPPAITLGVEKITTLLTKLNNPQKSLKVVHVSGTNGKGSVCAYVTSSLVASGLKVGQFNSPHLIDRWDCITINNTVIPQKAFLDIEKSVRKLSDDNNIGASSFEILTACALQYFAKKKVDVAVIETGMGGLTDATNVFSSPLVTIVTHISLDHTTYLGNTIQEIAAHKAGIIKPSSPVVISNLNPAAESVISETAKEKGSTLHVATGHWKMPSRTRYMVENVRFQDVDRLATPILGVVPGITGSHQAGNIASAVKALEILRGTFPDITEEAVQKGIASANIPGRMEWVRFELPEGRVPMLLDGAHNPASSAALADVVNELRRNSPVVWLIGFSQGRNVEECMAKYVKEGDSVACVEFGDVDGMGWVKPVDGEQIKRIGEILTGRPKKVEAFGKDVKKAIKWAVKQTKEERGMLIGTGSLYLVGEIHRLRRDDPEFREEEEDDEDDDML